jgi:hypothetical protein
MDVIFYFRSSTAACVSWIGIAFSFRLIYGSKQVPSETLLDFTLQQELSIPTHGSS